jgi:hypothetical protein
MTQISQTGWIVLIVLAVFFLPLFWNGLFMKEERWVCPECGERSDPVELPLFST